MPQQHAIHQLITWPRPFEALMNGCKTFEIRLNDRGFQVGDLLELLEYEPPSRTSDLDSTMKGGYTGRSCYRKVVYVLEGPQHGLETGYVAMGLDDRIPMKDIPNLSRGGSK